MKADFSVFGSVVRIAVTPETDQDNIALAIIGAHPQVNTFLGNAHAIIFDLESGWIEVYRPEVK